MMILSSLHNFTDLLSSSLIGFIKLSNTNSSLSLCVSLSHENVLKSYIEATCSLKTPFTKSLTKAKENYLGGGRPGEGRRIV